MMMMTIMMITIMMWYNDRYLGDRRQTLPALSARAISMDTLDHTASQVIMMIKTMRMLMIMIMMRRMRMKVKG